MDDFLPHVVGQEKVKREWQRLLSENRLPHTLILYGDEGLGKTTAALDLAGRITGKLDKVWEGAALIDPEKKEPVYTMADDQVWYLAPMGLELKIEQFRLFLEAMASFDAAPHVCIIDEAQTMMDPVANSLLKTLEEPEGNVHFLLITHDLAALLPTIVSRGERFPFLPLSEKDYLSLVTSQSQKYHFPKGLTPELAYQLSEGNPGITLEVCDEMGDPEPETAMKFWEIISRSETPFSTLMAADMKDRKAFLRKLRWITLVGRDLMLLADTGDARFARCVSVAGREAAVAPLWNEGRGEAALSVLEQANTAVSRYLNIKNIWDMVLLSLEHIRKGDRTWLKS